MNAPLQHRPPPASDDAPDHTPRADLVLVRDDLELRYDMLELRTLTPQGALLASDLLLELDEEISLDLTIDEGPVLRTRARVVRLVYELPGVEVAFSELDEPDRKRIENRTATAAET